MRARAARVEHHDLALRRRIRRVEHGLAVEAHVAVALLDHAVRLAGHDEALVAQPDVQRLAAAAQREEDLVGLGAGERADRDRPFERRDRRPERFGARGAGGHPPGDQRGDHLRVGGDLGRRPQ